MDAEMGFAECPLAFETGERVALGLNSLIHDKGWMAGYAETD